MVENILRLVLVVLLLVGVLIYLLLMIPIQSKMHFLRQLWITHMNGTLLVHDNVYNLVVVFSLL